MSGAHAEQVEQEPMLLAQEAAGAVTSCLAQPSRADVVRLDLRPHLQLI